MDPWGPDRARSRMTPAWPRMTPAQAFDGDASDGERPRESTCSWACSGPRGWHGPHSAGSHIPAQIGVPFRFTPLDVESHHARSAHMLARLRECERALPLAVLGLGVGAGVEQSLDAQPASRPTSARAGGERRRSGAAEAEGVQA